MAYLSNRGRVTRLPTAVRRPLTGLADTPAAAPAPAAPASTIPWKTIGILAAIPIVFAITGDK